MIGDDEYILEGGKFAGCFPSDVPPEELRYWAFKGSGTPLDRFALQEHFRSERRRRRVAALRRAQAAFPDRSGRNATAGACA